MVAVIVPIRGINPIFWTKIVFILFTSLDKFLSSPFSLSLTLHVFINECHLSENKRQMRQLKLTSQTGKMLNKAKIILAVSLII